MIRITFFHMYSQPSALRMDLFRSTSGSPPSSVPAGQISLQKYGAPDLDFYVDKKGDLSADLGIFTSPNTVLINRHGKEIGRIRGSVEWDDDEVIEYIYKIKAQNNQ